MKSLEYDFSTWPQIHLDAFYNPFNDKICINGISRDFIEPNIEFYLEHEHLHRAIYLFEGYKVSEAFDHSKVVEIIGGR